MAVILDGSTGVSAPAFDGALDATDLTGNVAAARITNALNAGGSAPIYACRAWVNFDGTTTTPTIRASGNVSSVTRISTGVHQVNLTTALPDANYAVSHSSSFDETGTANPIVYISTRSLTTTSFVVISTNSAGAGLNYAMNYAAAFR